MMLQGHFHISGENCKNVSKLKNVMYVIFHIMLLKFAYNKNKINTVFDETNIILLRGVRGLL